MKKIKGKHLKTINKLKLEEKEKIWSVTKHKKKKNCRFGK